jgi:thiamine biosynthesis lipoprotein
MAGLVALGPALAAAQEPEAEVSRRLAAMGTWLELEVRAADRPAALAASEAAVRAIEAVELRLSTWTEDSELARLNRTPPGEWRELSPELSVDLERARDLWRRTGGAFDPGLGALVEAWGLRSGGRVPAEEELAAARAAGGFGAFELEARRARRRHAGARIEEGGFGKGIGLDAAAAALVRSGARAARVDLGGQVLWLGEGGETALADPRERTRAVLALALPPGSLATSGNSERGFAVGGVRYSHVLDPRTGRPCADSCSTSVWAPDGTTADALSTGLHVLGPDAAFDWLRAEAGVELVVLRADGGRLSARLSAGWRGRVRVLVPELELRFEDALAPRSLSAVPPVTR